tara:strand:+ start:467 stop:652 length:186 start_codon:yes stop_codon:yes gene_type:complete
MKCANCNQSFFDENGECELGDLGDQTATCHNCGAVYELKPNFDFSDRIKPDFKQFLGFVKD